MNQKNIKFLNKCGVKFDILFPPPNLRGLALFKDQYYIIKNNPFLFDLNQIVRKQHIFSDWIISNYNRIKQIENNLEKLREEKNKLTKTKLEKGSEKYNRSLLLS